MVERTIAFNRAHSFEWIKFMIIAFFVMSFIDGLFTLYWISNGYAVEANPLMDSLIQVNGMLFLCVKTCVVGLSAVVLWKFRGMKISMVGSSALFLTYYTVNYMHFSFLAKLLAGSA